jgi:hypothetical protein
MVFRAVEPAANRGELGQALDRWRWRPSIAFRAKWNAIAYIFGIILIAFGGGFALARFYTPTAASAAVTSIKDFSVTLPEGETLVSISDSSNPSTLLAKVSITRDGERIEGISETSFHLQRRELNESDAAFFRRELSGIVLKSDSSFQRANRIREWLVRIPHTVSMPGLATRNPREVYQLMKSGNPVLCGNLADIYVGLLQSAGLTARTVNLSLLVRNGAFGADTHVASEVWIPELNQWVFEDPTFNLYWKVNDRPAGALGLHDALLAGQPLVPVAGDTPSPTPLESNYVDPRFYFRHIFYEYSPGGRLLYYVDGRLEPLSLKDRNWIQTADPTDILRLDYGGNDATERVEEVSPGIFAQLIGNELFIRDRRKQDGGLRVRSSRGPIHVCAYEHKRAEELGLFAGKNYVRNGAFRITGASGSIAAGWTVKGAVEGLTMLGGQGMSGGPGGRLEQRVQVKPGASYLLYSKLQLTRGTVQWSITDPSSQNSTQGMVTSAGPEEILSDVIFSKGNYLDLHFEVPEGGTFRLTDVIVAELPSAEVAAAKTSAFLSLEDDPQAIAAEMY